MKKIFYLFSISLILVSCAKEETLSEIPVIELVYAGPSQIKANVDSIYFSIGYEDLNGDLGTNNTNEANLFVEDMRINLVYEYRIQELVPNATQVPIRGVLNFSIDNTVITGSGGAEQVNYRIWVKDRAGNESNKVIAGPMEVIP